MKREFSEWPCSLARAVEVFGDSWTLLIVRDAMQGLTRFDEFQRSLNVARNTLSDRLNKLVEANVLTKQFYQDNPPRYEYVLTDSGRDFFPVLAAMLSWGDKWLDDGGGSPVTLHHHTFGHDLRSQVVCLECGEAVHHQDIQFVVGPGYPDDVAPELDIRHRLAEKAGGPGGRPGAGSAAVEREPCGPRGGTKTAAKKTAAKKAPAKKAPARKTAASNAVAKKPAGKATKRTVAEPGDGSQARAS